MVYTYKKSKKPVIIYLLCNSRLMTSCIYTIYTSCDEKIIESAAGKQDRITGDKLNGWVCPGGC
jgi:hypothetical protein